MGLASATTRHSHLAHLGNDRQPCARGVAEVGKERRVLLEYFDQEVAIDGEVQPGRIDGDAADLLKHERGEK
jgi:hypothetical protein